MSQSKLYKLLYSNKGQNSRIKHLDIHQSILCFRSAQIPASPLVQDPGLIATHPDASPSLKNLPEKVIATSEKKLPANLKISQSSPNIPGSDLRRGERHTQVNVLPQFHALEMIGKQLPVLQRHSPEHATINAFL